MSFTVTWDDIELKESAEATLDELFATYYEYALTHCKTVKQIKLRYSRYFEPFLNMRAAEITPKHVQRWHKAIGDNFGHPTANQSLRLMRTIFNHSIRMNLYAGKNPAGFIKAFRERSRERFLGEDEMPKFLEELDKQLPKNRDFFYLLLTTGARSNKVLSMRWEDINFKDRTWMIREDKNGDDQEFPLGPYALAALQRRGAKTTGWVFPAERRSSYMFFPRRAWERLRKKFPHLVAHDLRRTLATWEINTGASLEIVGRSLGHRSAESTRVYAIIQLNPIREAVDTAVDAMMLRRQ